MLLAHEKVNPADDSNSCIKLASQNGHTEIVRQLLLDPRVNPSDDNDFAFTFACENGHFEVVKLLLEDGRINLDTHGRKAIKKSAAIGFDKIVQLLIEHGVDPSLSDNNCIKSACKNGHIAVVKVLLADRRVDPTADNHVAIISSAENGYVEVVKHLLEDGRVDPCINDNQPIKRAIQNKHGSVVSALLENQKVFQSFKFVPEPENPLASSLFHVLTDVQNQINLKKQSIDEKDNNITYLFLQIESLRNEIQNLQGLIEMVELDTQSKNNTINALLEEKAKTCEYLSQIARFLQGGQMETLSTSQ